MTEPPRNFASKLRLDPLNGRFAKIANGLARVFCAENCGTSNDDFRSSLNHTLNVIEIDAAVDFYAHGQTTLIYHLSQSSHLVERCRDELLTSKAGVNRHYQNIIDKLEYLVQGLNRRRGIDDGASLRSRGLDRHHCAMQMRISFHMHRHHAGTGLNELFGIETGVTDHQMGINRKLRYSSERLNHR